MSQTRRITLKDLACHTRVSVSTVSRALRNDPQIPEATCRRIQQAAAELGYRTNPYIANLMANVRRGTEEQTRIPLGLIVERRNRFFTDSSYYRCCIEGMERRAEALGYYLVRVHVEEDAERSIGAGLRMLRSRGIRGVVVAPLYAPGCDLSGLDWSGLSAVTIGHSLARPRMTRVSTNDYAAIQRVLEELSRRSFRRIGYCMLRSTDAVLNRAWLAGFKAYQHDLPAEEVVPVYQDDFRYREEPLKSWLMTHRPEVVICCRSVVAEYIRSWGVKIPEDVALVDLNRTSGAFAGIDQRIDTLGATAIDQLVAQIHRNEFTLPAIGTETLVEGRWADGDSLGSAASCAAALNRG